MRTLVYIIIGVGLLVGISSVNGDEKKPLGTAITSERMEMESSDVQNIMHFYGNVEVNSDQFHAKCDTLEVFADKGSKDPNKKKMGQAGVIEKIIAEGNVYIEQEGKTAKSGYAEIFPQEGKVVLEDQPEVKDEDGVVSGYRMVLYKGHKKAYVEGSPNGERPRVLLPIMPDLLDEDKKIAKAEKKGQNPSKK